MHVNQKIKAALAEFERRILPAKIKDTSTNGKKFAVWFEENGISIKDATADDLYRACVQLKSVIDWEVAPRKGSADGFQQSSTPGQHRSHTAPVEVGETSVRNAVRKIDAEKAKVVLRECRNLCESHSTHPHSKANRERAALLERFNMLVANSPTPITLKQAEAIKVEVSNLQKTFSKEQS